MYNTNNFETAAARCGYTFEHIFFDKTGKYVVSAKGRLGNGLKVMWDVDGKCYTYWRVARLSSGDLPLREVVESKNLKNTTPCT